MKPIGLKEHPEGGRYLRVFKSDTTVYKANGKIRSALSHIYYSLKKDEVSCFHKVESDEVWNLYQGEGVYLYLWDGSKNSPERIELSSGSNSFCHVVPGGIWQAAEPICGDVLVGCSVGPGFEYTDYELVEPNSELVEIIKEHHKNLIKFTRPESVSTKDKLALML